MTRSWVMVVVAAGVVVVGVALLWTVSRSDGLTRDQAIAIAERHVASASRATFLSASSGRLGDFDSSVVQNGDRSVWEVTFDGEFRVGSCGPLQPNATPGPCPYGPSSLARVYIDDQTGEFVMMAHVGS